VITTAITTKNGRYVRDHDNEDEAWGYIRAFVAVTNDAEWEWWDTDGQ